MSKILVVDDERSVQEALSMLLTDNGHSIDTAEDGEEALARITAQPYDLVVTDILMPKMNGLDLLRAIRQGGNTVPVIMITAHANVENASLAIRAGATDYVIKPFEINTILSSINYILQDRSLLPNAEAATPQDSEVTRRAWEQRLAQLSLSDDVDKSLVGAEDFKRDAAQLMDWMQKRLSTRRVWLGVRALQGENLIYQCACPDEASTMEEYHSMEEHILAELVLHGKSIVSRNIGQELGFHTDYAKAPDALLAVPIKQRGQVRGGVLLYPHTTEQFKHSHFQFVVICVRLLAHMLDNTELHQELESTHGETVQALFSGLETKDSQLAAHAARVACFAVLLGKRLGLSENERRDLEYVALLHDIGKIFLPSGASPEEMASHSVLGEGMIRSLSFLPQGAAAVRHHHEWFNGEGYPDGRQGEDIPLFSRILAVADGFDHLAGESSPNDKRGQQRALEQMMRNAGKQFDPKLLNAFVAAYRDVLMLN